MKISLLVVILFFMLFAVSASSEDLSQKQYNFFKDQKTFIKNPFELRDPFRRLIDSSKNSKRKGFKTNGENNVFTNILPLEEVALEKIKIVGVLLGKDRRAMAQVEGSKETFVLKEGMKLGVDGAEIKAILPGGIVLVEKIVNVYDQEEYLETIIPMSDN
ncbi:MAG: pilus assembly protein PilP [Bdellovibrio sp.]|nr:pilus assembly protein PilP [Bdellovibrio sp.]